MAPKKRSSSGGGGTPASKKGRTLDDYYVTSPDGKPMLEDVQAAIKLMNAWMYSP